MRIAIFGNCTDSQLSGLKKSPHILMLTDHPGDKKLVEVVTKLKLTNVVVKAEWHNVEHETAQIDTRISHSTGEIEQYNKNGGTTRDAVLLEQVDAVIVGEGVSETRTKLIAASQLPVQRLAAPKLTVEEAQTELDRLFS